jgi:hypothetical protein
VEVEGTRGVTDTFCIPDIEFEVVGFLTAIMETRLRYFEWSRTPQSYISERSLSTLQGRDKILACGYLDNRLEDVS